MLHCTAAQHDPIQRNVERSREPAALFSDHPTRFFPSVMALSSTRIEREVSAFF